MPNKKPKKARVAPAQRAQDHAREEPIIHRFVPLVMEERDRLTAILSDPAFIKAWRNAKALRPSPFRGNFSAEHGQLAACNKLHEIRGFEAFQAALLAQAEEPKPKNERVAESFPNAGNLDNAPEFQPAKKQ
jgi:hypothetical protein